MATNGTGVSKETLLKAITTAFNAYVKLWGNEAQAAWLAYQKGRQGPDADKLKAAFEAFRTPERMEAWRAYEAARAAFKAATGERAPQMRYPKLVSEVAKAKAKVAVTA